MPARRLTFIEENIRSAWEAVGIIPFNPRRAIGSLKRKEPKVPQEKVLAATTAPRIPKTLRAVSRITRTAASLVTKTTPSSLRLKELLSNLSEEFQQTIADKVVEEEAHRQYRQLMRKEKNKNTSDRRKLTEATVVTSETVRMLRKERERVDAAKVARITNPRARSHKTSGPPKTSTLVESSGPGKDGGMLRALVQEAIQDELEDLWEEMEALEVGGDSNGEEDGGVVGEMIRVHKRH